MNIPLGRHDLANISEQSRSCNTCMDGPSVKAYLRFKKHGKQTYLIDQFTPHPFHITRPFRIESDPDGMATLYLQSSAGGLYHDDNQTLKIDINDGALAHITSQASTIIHNSHVGSSQYRTLLDVGENAWLEYCPEPNILFPGAFSKNAIHAKVRPSSRLILCDSQLFHDPDQESAPFQELRNEIIISGDDDIPFFSERAEIKGSSWFAATDGHQCAGTFIIYEPKMSDKLVSGLENCIAQFEPNLIYCGQSYLADRSIISVRLLAKSGLDLSNAMQTLWACTRIAITGKNPQPRRK